MAIGATRIATHAMRERRKVPSERRTHAPRTQGGMTTGAGVMPRRRDVTERENPLRPHAQIAIWRPSRVLFSNRLNTSFAGGRWPLRDRLFGVR